MKSIAIFCASSPGFEKLFAEKAFQLGLNLAKKNISVVYGGAQVGLMGALADGALSESGKVIGVLPHFLNAKEIAHPGLTELITTETMHERKSTINDHIDGVIALPGGFGTMDELFEMLTWGQLGLHKKPIGLWNINKFYNPLLKMTQNMVDFGFLKEINQQMLLVSNDLNELVEMMENYQAPEVPKWLKREEI